MRGDEPPSGGRDGRGQRVSGRPRLECVSDRDRAVLELLAITRFASTDQIARATFASGTVIGRRRRAQAALARMTEVGLVIRLERRIGGIRAGSAGFIYRLGPRAHQCLGGPAKRPSGDPAWENVDHQLAVAELAAQLIEGQRSGLCAGLQLVGEPGCWRQFSGPAGVRLVKPDLEVRFNVGTRRAVWWVEIDRATQAPTRIRTKAIGYLDYWRTGIEQAAIGGFPRVLFVAPDHARAGQITRALGGINDPGMAMFAVTTDADAASQILTPPDGDSRGEQSIRKEEHS